MSEDYFDSARNPNPERHRRADRPALALRVPIEVGSRGANGAGVFWFLILMGVITFAPCIIIPEWRSYQAANAAQQREEHRVRRLRDFVERERRQLDAIQNDPTVVARLAQRDLGFVRPGDTAVAVPVERNDEFEALANLNDDDAFVPKPAEPPVWFSRATWWLPNLNYDAIFCDASTRPIVMLMSLSVIVVAVVLFHRSRPSEG